MAGAADIVEQYPGKVQLAVEIFKTLNQSCGTAGHATRINHEKYRQFELFGHFGG